ncbi:MAG: response regulator [Solirubrobacteraceae bacterium]
MSIGADRLAGQEGTRITVLVVDDDLEFGRLASDLLTDLGYHVVGWARTGNDAIAECDRLDPDAVLLDIKLPDANGVNVAKALGAAGRRRRILLTSADRAAVGPNQLRASGAAGFVAKTELARRDLGPFLRP